MTGLAPSSMPRTSVRELGSAREAGVLKALMSAPPQKSLPAPVMTMACTFGSAQAVSRWAATSWRRACPMPLTGGLFSTMTAVRPWTEKFSMAMRGV